MELIKELSKELNAEAGTTRKFLALVPVDKLDWAPHEKSMKMGDLAIHIAELPTWVKLGLETEGLDFATMEYQPPTITSSQDLLNLFENSLKEGQESLEKATLEDMNKRWVLRSGDKIHADLSSYETIRHSFAQTAHHRAQLGVYFRLLNIPVPSSYGPSADETDF